jgi:hypothetical protein
MYVSPNSLGSKNGLAGMIERLQADICFSPPKGGLVIDYHVNTKLAQIVMCWSAQDDTPENQARFTLWKDLAADYLASITSSDRTICKQGQDPLRASRAEFPGGKAGDVVKIVKDMAAVLPPWTNCKQELVNLVELAVRMGSASVEQERDIREWAYGTRKTNEEEIREYIEELEGGAMLGEGSIIKGNGFMIYQARGEDGEVVMNVDSTRGSIICRGLTGGRCEFPFLVDTESRQVLVMQRKAHKDTSITNLAEFVAAPLLKRFPGHGIVEHYEGSNRFCRIELDGGYPRWQPIPESELPKLRKMAAALSNEAPDNQRDMDL